MKERRRANDDDDVQVISLSPLLVYQNLREARVRSLLRSFYDDYRTMYVVLPHCKNDNYLAFLFVVSPLLLLLIQLLLLRVRAYASSSYMVAAAAPEANGSEVAFN